MGIFVDRPGDQTINHLIVFSHYGLQVEHVRVAANIGKSLVDVGDADAFLPFGLLFAHLLAPIGSSSFLPFV